MNELLSNMIEARQLSYQDATVLAAECETEGTAPGSEAEVLRWLAHEYDLPYSDLENVDLVDVGFRLCDNRRAKRRFWKLDVREFHLHGTIAEGAVHGGRFQLYDSPYIAGFDRVRFHLALALNEAKLNSFSSIF